MNTRPFGLRRWAVTGLIIASLAGQATQNLSVGFIGEVAEPPPAQAAAWVIDRAHAALGQFAFYTSTNTYWRMFSPVHKIDWWWTIVATSADGSERALATPDVSASSASSLLVGFRDAKMMLNLWTRPSMQAAYLDHRCAQEKRTGTAPKGLRLELHWRAIPPPTESTVSGTRPAAAQSHRVMATRACS